MRRLDDIDSKDERSRKDDIQYEHLKKARQELGTSLAEFDKRLHEIHLRLAARIENTSLAQELRDRTHSIMVFQPFVSHSRGWDRWLRADCDLANEMLRLKNQDTADLGGDNEDALRRMAKFLNSIKASEYAHLSRLIEGTRLDQFLCSHTRLPDSQKGILARRIENTWLLWREFRRKADWLHVQLLVEMLQTQEQIAGLFADRMLTPSEQKGSAD